MLGPGPRRGLLRLPGPLWRGVPGGGPGAVLQLGQELSEARRVQLLLLGWTGVVYIFHLLDLDGGIYVLTKESVFVDN